MSKTNKDYRKDKTGLYKNEDEKNKSAECKD